MERAERNPEHVCLHLRLFGLRRQSRCSRHESGSISKYLEWGKRNFSLNDLDPGGHDFIYGDVSVGCGVCAKTAAIRRDYFDPPTFSTSAHGVFRVETDYGKLIAFGASIVEAGCVLLHDKFGEDKPGEISCDDRRGDSLAPSESSSTAPRAAAAGFPDHPFRASLFEDRMAASGLKNPKLPSSSKEPAAIGKQRLSRTYWTPFALVASSSIGALCFDDQWRGLGAHHIAVALRISDVNQ
jgi:hypothetical protein